MNIASLLKSRSMIDDRGQSVECRSLREIQRRASRDPELVPTTDRIVAEALTHFSMWNGALFGLFFMAIMVVSMTLFRSQPMWLRFAPIVVLAPIAGLAMNRIYWRKVVPGLTRILIEEGICAGCMYPLEGLAEDQDGMLVCPECSASWQRSRVIRFAPIARNAVSRTLRGELSHFLRQMRSGFDRRGIRDDRDSPRAVIALRATRKVAAAATDDHRNRLIAAAKVLKPIGRLKRLAFASVFLAMVVSMAAPVVAITQLRSSLPMLTIAPLALAGSFQLIMAFSIFFSDLGRPSTLVRAKFLKKDLCPCCAADLRGQSPDDDGCTTCPNCSAAWLDPDHQDPAQL